MRLGQCGRVHVRQGTPYRQPALFKCRRAPVPTGVQHVRETQGRPRQRRQLCRQRALCSRDFPTQQRARDIMPLSVRHERSVIVEPVEAPGPSQHAARTHELIAQRATQAPQLTLLLLLVLLLLLRVVIGDLLIAPCAPALLRLRFQRRPLRAYAGMSAAERVLCVALRHCRHRGAPLPAHAPAADQVGDRQRRQDREQQLRRQREHVKRKGWGGGRGCGRARRAGLRAGSGNLALHSLFVLQMNVKGRAGEGAGESRGAGVPLPWTTPGHAYRVFEWDRHSLG